MPFEAKAMPDLRARALATALGQRGQFDYYPGRITPGWYSSIGVLSVREMLAGVLAWLEFNDTDGKNITPDVADKPVAEQAAAWFEALRVVPQAVLVAIYDSIQEDLRAGPKLVNGSASSSSEKPAEPTNSFSPSGTPQ